MKRQSRNWIRAVVCGVAAVLVAAVAAAPTGQQTPGQTTFRALTDLVVVDFMAIADDGRPVADLKKEELTLKVGGKIREIKSLEFVRFAEVEETAPTAGANTSTTSGAAVAAARPASPFGSNVLKEAGRDVFLVVDHESMLPGGEGPARASATRFLAGLGPRDRVALVTVPNGRVEVDLTTNRARVLDRLGAITGHRPPEMPGDAYVCQLAMSGRATVIALTDMFESLRRQDGPKTVVLISGGTPPSAILTSSNVCEYTLDASRYEDLGHAASRASVQLYILQPLEIPGSASVPARNVGSITSQLGDAYTLIQQRAEGLGDLAGVTGGELFRLSGNADAAFAKIARSSSAYYLLGFAPEPSERNGKTHKISVDVSRAHVDIRARPEFEIPDPAKVAAKAAASPVTAETMLLDRTAYRDLPMHATAYAVRASDRTKLKVVVIAESADVAVPFASAAFGLVDVKDRMVAHWSADAQELGRRPLATATMVAPGEYRLRVAARDAAGHGGAADFEFEAKLTRAGDYDVSDVLLGLARSDAFVPTFVYTTEPETLAYLEIYKMVPDAPDPHVTIELASTIDGPARASVAAKSTPTREPDRWVVAASLPLDDLPPGDYVVRALVMQGGKVVGRVVRTLSKGLR